MKGLETGKDKIQKICDELRRETLEPAVQEANEIVENARIQASEIVKEAEKNARGLIEKAERQIEEKKKVFQSSLALACRQGIEDLKQKIEKELFHTELARLLQEEMTKPKVLADLINAVIKVIEEKGVEEEFVASIPKGISPKSINELLASSVLRRLEEGTVVTSEILGGVEIQLKEQKIAVDISEGAVRELVAQYIRKDLRDLIFNV